MRSLRYKKPLVANSLYLTPEIFDLETVDVSRHVYVHVAFVRPGKHTFCISNDLGLID